MRQRRPGSSERAARARVDELRRRADAITSRILYSDEPRIDLDIAIGALRDDVERRYPDRLWLFEVVYEARWKRLREQGWARTEEA
ncbi:MAG: hypothetical protein ACYSX0_12285 [Planctomycetota bacterium]|jgi:hypothetical protein